MNLQNEALASSFPLLSWRGHVAATLKLGLPLIGAQLAQVAIGATDTVMIGWLGSQELAASVLGATTFFLALMLGSGFAFAIMPIVAQEQAKGDARTVRRSVRMGMWIVAIYAAAMMLPLWLIEPVLNWLGQKPELASLAAGYVRIAQWALFPALFVMALRSFLSAMERPGIVLFATISAALINAALNYMLIFGNFGAPRLELQGAAIASVASSLLSFMVLIVYCNYQPMVRRFELFVRWWIPDWSAFGEVARLGWPISLTVIAEVMLFTASSVMMGWIGTIELAAHGIALQLASVVFMIPLGLASAATVRVGQAHGRGDRPNLVRASLTATGLAAGVALASAALFIFAPQPLVWLFLERSNPDAEAVAGFAVFFLAIAAAFQLFDMGQAIAAGLLRGLSDTLIPMRLAVVSYWLAGVPLAYLLAFPMDLGGGGLWAGLAAGLALAAILLGVRFWRMVR